MLRKILGVTGVLVFVPAAGWSASSSAAHLVAGRDNRAIILALCAALSIWGAAWCGHIAHRAGVRPVAPAAPLAGLELATGEPKETAARPVPPCPKKPGAALV